MVTTALRMVFPPIITHAQMESPSITVNDANTMSIAVFPENTEIPGRRCSLKRSIVAQIESTKDGFTVSSGSVEEEGFGSTYSAAILDFLTSLCDRFNSLSRRKKALSREDKAVMDHLSSLLQV